MLIRDICLGQGDIFVRHFHVRVPKDIHQGKNIASCSQKLYGESVPEGMRRTASCFDLRCPP